MVLDVDDFGVAFDFDLVAYLGARGIVGEGDTDAGLAVVDFEGVAIQRNKGDDTAEFDGAGFLCGAIGAEVLDGLDGGQGDPGRIGGGLTPRLTGQQPAEEKG